MATGFGFFVCVLLCAIALTESRLLPSDVQTIVSALKTREVTRPSFCGRLRGLSTEQRDWCKRHPSFIPALGMGGNLAKKECESTFEYDRWNCTLNDGSVATLANRQSKETGFVDAMMSAGIMMAISRMCTRGELTKYCGCDKSVLDDDSNDGFEWGGCGDDFQKGKRWSRDFLDPPINTTGDAPEKILTKSVQKWNNRRGRLAVAETLAIVCKCHGLCGDCTVKICWKEVRSVTLGRVLKESFHTAKHVRLANPSSTTLQPISVTESAMTTTRRSTLTPQNIAYVTQSPDYCVANSTLGVLGTAKRRCKKDSQGEDGCDLLCCGNGHYETRDVKREKCDCKFEWCCQVKCRWCHRVYQRYHCKTPGRGSA